MMDDRFVEMIIELEAVRCGAVAQCRGRRTMAARRTTMAEAEKFDVLIVGGGPVGLSENGVRGSGLAQVGQTGRELA